MKVCSKCGESKNLQDFPTRKSSPDGFRSYCKECKYLQDSVRRKERLSDPDKKEKELQRLRDLRSKMSDQEKQAIKVKTNEKNRLKSEARKAEFFAEHGCTKQEYKYKQDREKFIELSKSVHGDKYDYTAVEYSGVWEHVNIKCNKHNTTFRQTPKEHKRGRGCPECAKEATGNALRKSQEDFISDAIQVHGDTLTYEYVEYLNNNTHVTVTCKQHGCFPVKPGNLLNGRGCPSCASYGYNRSKPGAFYILVCDDITKVGITNREVVTRLGDISKSYGHQFFVLFEQRWEDGSIAYAIEKAILAELKEKYNQPTEEFDGSTECFLDVDWQELLTRIHELIKENT